MLFCMRGWDRADGRRRGFLLIAAIAIGFALLMLLAPQGHSGNAHLVAILPLLFAGIVSPLSLLGALEFFYAGRVPEAPVMAAAFQRPPPTRRR
jgi:hypothetical protein